MIFNEFELKCIFCKKTVNKQLKKPPIGGFFTYSIKMNYYFKKSSLLFNSIAGNPAFSINLVYLASCLLLIFP